LAGTSRVRCLVRHRSGTGGCRISLSGPPPPPPFPLPLENDSNRATGQEKPPCPRRKQAIAPGYAPCRGGRKRARRGEEGSASSGRLGAGLHRGGGANRGRGRGARAHAAGGGVNWCRAREEGRAAAARGVGVRSPAWRSGFHRGMWRRAPTGGAVTRRGGQGLNLN